MSKPNIQAFLNNSDRPLNRMARICDAVITCIFILLPVFVRPGLASAIILTVACLVYLLVAFLPVKNQPTRIQTFWFRGVTAAFFVMVISIISYDIAVYGQPDHLVLLAMFITSGLITLITSDFTTQKNILANAYAIGPPKVQGGSFASAIGVGGYLLSRLFLPSDEWMVLKAILLLGMAIFSMIAGYGYRNIIKYRIVTHHRLTLLSPKDKSENADS